MFKSVWKRERGNMEFIKMYGREQGGTQGGTLGAQAPRPPKMRPQHQNSTKLRPQDGSFRP